MESLDWGQIFHKIISQMFNKIFVKKSWILQGEKVRILQSIFEFFLFWF